MFGVKNKVNKINIGIIGLGTVGCGVVKTLKNFPNINIVQIAVRNKNKKRNIDNLNESIITDNAYDIVNNPEIDIVVEVAGGVNPAFDLLTKALNNGKNIVTANKELLAKHGDELFKLANEKGLIILYEAAIAGGIPIIMPLKMTLCGNKISKIQGILNGTTNYILTKMKENKEPYEDVLKEAQDLGYAETDPTNDVMGYDAAYKICTLAKIGFNSQVDINKIYTEGITKITDEDIEFADELGYTIKLVAQASLNEQSEADIRVHPVLVKNDNVLAKISNATNAVKVCGAPVGEVCFIGPGAGEMPTASSVVGDILILASEIENTNGTKSLCLMMKNSDTKASQIDISQTENEYYMLIVAQDHKGVIGTIGKICGDNNISIQTVMQRGIENDNMAKIVVITSKSKENDIKNAIDEMKTNESICTIKSLIRVLN